MSMRTRVRAITATAALAAAGLTLAGAAPASASGGTSPATAAPAPASAAAVVPWSDSHGTASAAGERWLENGKLVLDGTLTNTGTGCYSVWTRLVHDWVVRPWVKHSEICGAGSVDFTAARDYTYLTSGTLKVCRGTTDTTDCSAGVGITHWPIE